METKLELLKKLALKVTSATSISEVKGETISEVLDYIEENWSSISGDKGEDGVGISNIELVSTSGLVDTYKITLTNENTYNFTVTNGDKGEQGEVGVGIANIELVSTSGLEDTYKISLTNGNSHNFTVTNGDKGDQGEKGASIASLKLTVNASGVVTGGEATLSDDSKITIEVDTESE